MKKKTNLILFGAGGHAKSVIEVIESTKKYRILFLVDNYEGFLGRYKVVREKKDINYYKKFTNKAHISIGHIKKTNPRIKIYKKLKENNFILPKIISSSAHVSKNSTIGEGSIIMNHALVNSGAKIGNNCIINSKSLVEHDSVIGDNCHLSTGSIINGNCKIDVNSFIGSNTVLIQNIKIKKNSFIGAGKTIKNSKKK